MIALLGSVFSPYYAAARRRGRDDPFAHCALNAVLYGAGRKRWAMTERSRRSVTRDAASLSIGPSSLAWDGTRLEIDVDEVTVPFPSRLRGRIRLEPTALVAERFALAATGRHLWRPLAPCAHVEVSFERPALRWRGRAYLDSNHGDEPLEDAFASWHWSRAALEGGRTAVLYDVVRRAGDPLALALRFQPGGAPEPIPSPPRCGLSRTPVWRIPRETRADGPARVEGTLEDTPFYARSVLSAPLLGTSATGVHESLSLDRFRQRWVQGLLPFRMPRRG